MTVLTDLADRWRDDADVLAHRGDDRGAGLLRQAAGELDHAIENAQGEMLTLSEAAAESGYSPRRLRELATDGVLENVGRRGAPRFRRGDLPRKSRAPAGAYDPATDAAEVLGRIQPARRTR